MPKYIIAKDLLDEAMSKSVEVKVINGDGVEGNLENAVTITDLISIASYLYPADVVEIVRCKDCKYFFDFPKGAPGCSFCSKHSTVTKIFEKNENWFCADGERKKTEWHYL